jgi:hypothetical protein
MFRKLSILAVLSATPLFAQSTSTPTWYTVVPASAQSPNISVTLPAGTTYRFGDTQNNIWGAPVTVTAQTTISDFDDGQSGRPADPDPGTQKELDILQTSGQQAVSVTNVTASPATIAVIVPSLVPPTVVDATPGSNHTLTFTNFTVAPGSTQNALMFAFVNQPANNANNTWEGTQMNLSIDGVTLVCTYGQTYTSGVFTLSCTVPSSTAGSTVQTASN